MALEPAKLSDFKLAGALGSGTTARVYEAVHVVTGRPVAIKVMEQASSTSEMRERFAREALLLSGVTSRHVSKILGFGFDKGQPFLVLERLHGETLDAKLRRDGPVPPNIALRWIEQLIVGIRDCHDQKVIHRDIKPSNIYLHHDGFDEIVKLIDFGVARLREITEDTGGLTSSNHLIGSMGYMAPEQFKSAKTVGYPADLYALGVVIFRTLTGRLPFVSRSLDTIIRMKTEQSAPPMSTFAPNIPKNQLLEWFVQKAMAREPEERFQNAREMLEQWWNVMASMEEGATEVSHEVPPVVNANANAVAKRPQTAPPPTIPHAPMSHQDTAIGFSIPLQGPEEDDLEDRTIRRLPRDRIALPSHVHRPPTMPAPAMPVASPPPGSVTSHSRPISDRTLPDEMVPRTVPSQELAAAAAAAAMNAESNNDDTTAVGLEAIRDDQLEEGGALDGEDDPFDLPTRNDPNLRKLVERELELQKARKRGS